MNFPFLARLCGLAGTIGLLLSSFVTAGEVPSPYGAFAGAEMAQAETHWIAPYVLCTSKVFAENRQKVVSWFDPTGKVIKEISGDVYESNGYVHEAKPQYASVIHSLDGWWTIALPPIAHPFPWDGPILVQGEICAHYHYTNWEAGQMILDVYSRGKQVGTAGPFIARSEMAKLGVDGCTILQTWKERLNGTPQVVIVGPDAKVRLQQDCDANSEPYAFADGKGALMNVPTEEGLPDRYLAVTAEGTHQLYDKLSGGNPIARVPSSDLVLFYSDVKKKEFQLMHGASGEIVWNIPSPLRSTERVEQVGPSALVVEDMILLLGIDIAAVDLKTGELRAIWKSTWNERTNRPVPVGGFYRLGDDIYIVGNDSFFKMNLRDIKLKVHGWE
jgi:hypothetical protein